MHVEYFVVLLQFTQADGKCFLHNDILQQHAKTAKTTRLEDAFADASETKLSTNLPRVQWGYIMIMLHLIRCVCCATSKVKTRYRYCIRPTNTDITSRTDLVYHTNLIRFTRRTVVEFNCRMVLELISS